MIGLYVLIATAVIVVLTVLVFFFVRSSQQTGRDQGNEDDKSTATLKEIIDRDRQIKKLEVKISTLSKLNSHYLSFLFKVPTIVQRLNATASVQSITLTIVHMVNDIIGTDKVDLYLFEEQSNLLKKLSLHGDIHQEQVSYDIGEGLIAAAAKHRFIMVQDHFSRMCSPQQDNKDAGSQLWMAAPIIFKDRLLGVIGIGKVENPVGNENDLLMLIADIAGVALINQITLDEAQYKANTDPLTGLNNRNYFFHMAQRYIEKSMTDGSPISVFLFDIDNFKHYNDTNGHAAGDKLLIELSQLIRETTRKESTVARYGGEEFIIMLPGIAGKEALLYAERLREEISRYPFQHREKQPLGCLSVSGGIASFPEDGNSIHKVIQLADTCLYQAKAEGKNRVLLYKPHSCPPNSKAIDRVPFQSTNLS